MAYCPYDDCEQYIDVDADEDLVTCPKCGRISEVITEISLVAMKPMDVEEA